MAEAGQSQQHRSRKNTFTNELLKLIQDDPTSEWYTDDKSKPTRAGNRMAKPEYMIAKYELNHWKNPCYRGNDLIKSVPPSRMGRTVALFGRI